MRRRNDRQVLLLSLVLFGASMSIFGEFSGIAALSEAIGRVIAPVDRLVGGGLRAVGGALDGSRDARALAQRVDELEAELAALEVNAAKLGDVSSENERLRRLLDFRTSRVDLDLIGSSVVGATIGREPGSLLHTVWIDIGRDEGAVHGAPVVVGHGLVGRVVRTYGSSSHVRLLTDPSSRVGVRIERSRATGMLVGSPSGELTIDYIPQNVAGRDSMVEVGDLVFTSGLADGAHVPRMIPVGQVVEVRQSDEKTAQVAAVRPHVDFGALEEVLVVVDWDPSASALDGEAAPDEDG